jgi:outer membrane protein OmpA-like peptidoglycan-associated protein
LKLSKARAESVKARLVKLGVDPSRLSTAGAGAGEPIATNKTLQGRALNRRVVLARTDR